MNHLVSYHTYSLLLAVSLLGCHGAPGFPISGDSNQDPSTRTEQVYDSNFYDRVAQELIEMEARDQEMNQMVVDGVAEARQEEFQVRKANLYATHTARAKDIYGQLGYPSSHLVGSQAEHAFWLIVQHSDAQPAFQEQVAGAMRPIVLAGGASADRLALLVDRVLVNTGKPQRYGSQVQFDLETGRAMPKALEDPKEVDSRRLQVGLEPLWKYMNDLCELQFMMNKGTYQEQGVLQPWAYPEGYLDW